MSLLISILKQKLQESNTSTLSNASTLEHNLWEKNFLAWLNKFLSRINANKGKLNCDRCSLLLNDILSNGLPEEGVQPVQTTKTGMITYPKFNEEGQIVSSKTFDPRILDRFQVKKLDFGDFVFCEDEGISDFRLVEKDIYQDKMKPQDKTKSQDKTKLPNKVKPPKSSDNIAWIQSSRQSIHKDLSELLRRKGTLTWNNKNTIHGLVLLTHVKKENWGHLINFVVGPNNEILFIDAQSGEILKALPNKIYRDEVYFLTSQPPEGYSIKVELIPKIKREVLETPMEVGNGNGNSDGFIPAPGFTLDNSINFNELSGRENLNGSSNSLAQKMASEMEHKMETALKMTQKTEIAVATEVAKDKPGITQIEAIIKAITSGSVDKVKSLMPENLTMHTNFNDEVLLDGNYITPLHAALLAGFEMVKLILGFGAKVTQPYRHAPHLMTVARSLPSLDPRILPLLETSAIKEISGIWDFEAETSEYRIYNSDYRMRKAAFLGDVQRLKTLLNHSMNELNSWQGEQILKSNSGYNLVMLAALGGSVEMLKFIIQHFAKRINLNTGNEVLNFCAKSYRYKRDALFLREEFSLLHVAGVGGHRELLEYLQKEHSEFYKKYEQDIAIGAIEGGHLWWVTNPGISLKESKDYTEGLSPLLCSAYKGNEQAFDAILKSNHKALLERDVNDKHVLHWAVFGKNRKIIEKVLDLKLNLLFEADKNGTTPLMIAAEISVELTALLLEKAGNEAFKLLFMVDKQSRNLAFYAMGMCQREVLQYIFSRYQHQPYQLYPDSRKLLYAYDASGNNVLHHAMVLPEFSRSPLDKRIEVIRFMVSKDCDPEGRLLYTSTNQGLLPIHLAARTQLSFFEQFVNLDPKMISLVDNQGKPTLFYSLDSKEDRKLDISKYILDKDPMQMFTIDHQGKTIFNYLDEILFYNVEASNEFRAFVKKRAEEVIQHLSANLTQVSPSGNASSNASGNANAGANASMKARNQIIQQMEIDGKLIQEKDTLLTLKDEQIAKNAKEIEHLKALKEEYATKSKASNALAGNKRSREEAGLPESIQPPPLIFNELAQFQSGASNSVSNGLSLEGNGSASSKKARTS